jgi:hypothetical protein
VHGKYIIFHCSVFIAETLLYSEQLVDLDVKLVSAVSAFRRRRNALAPVNRLLPETLATIFTMLQEEMPSFRPVYKNRSDLNSWLAVSRVCRYWRATCISTPTLWSSIHIRGHRNSAVGLHLERSSTAPLKVYYAAYNHEAGSAAALDADAILNNVAKNCERFREFHCLSHRAVTDQTWSLFTRGAPFLESLTLSVENQDPDETSPVLPTVFGDHTPRLQKLAIRYFSSWPGNTFKSLTHISLNHQPSIGRYSLSQFLDFLRGSPNLEELSLVKAGPQIGEISPEDIIEPVSFPSLRILEIGSWPTASPIARFLSHLDIGRGVDVRIWGRDIFDDDQGDDLSLLFQPGTRQLERLQAVKTVRITWTANYNQFIFVKDSTLDVHGFFYPLTYLSVSVVCFAAEVEELWLAPPTDTSEPTVEQYGELFRSLPQLKTLIACKANLHSMLLALGICRSSDDGGSLTCPKLDTLHLYYGGNGGSSLPFCLFAETRAKRGQPIRSFQTDSMGDEDAEFLRRYIYDVKVVEPTYFREKMLQPIWPRYPSGFNWTYPSGY